MKIKMPEFLPFSDNMLEEDQDCGVVFAQEYNINQFPFYCTIVFDGGYADENDSYYMYGYITPSKDLCYEGAIIISNDIILSETKVGKLRKSDIKKAYNVIIKQLRQKYKIWVTENIMESKLSK